MAWHVQQGRREPADGLQVVRGEHVGHGVGLGGQETVGPQLGGREPDLRHLREHTLGRKLVAPARHLAHTPRDRGSGDPVHAFSFNVTVVPVRQDSVAAMARSNAASASRPVHRGGVPSRTQRANASSSAA